MKYYWKETGSIAFNSDAEMTEYYERIYNESVESGCTNPEDCSLQDWIESDTSIVDEIYYEECMK